MSETPKIAVVGIDIGKNSFHVVGLISAVRLCCGRSGCVASRFGGSTAQQRKRGFKEYGRCDPVVIGVRIRSGH